MVDVKPIQAKTYKHTQSPSEFMPKLPARIIINGFQEAGKVSCASIYYSILNCTTFVFQRFTMLAEAARWITTSSPCRNTARVSWV